MKRLFALSGWTLGLAALLLVLLISTKLLQPNDRGLGWPQHQDGVDLRQIDALIENIDGKDDVEFSCLQTLKGGHSRRRGLA